MEYAASKLASVLPSASVVVSQQAKALKAAGEDVIDLGLGEPDFDTPDHIVQAAHAAALAGQTRYPPFNGTLELIAAVQGKFKRDNDLHFSAAELIVCNGAKQVIFNAMMATLEENQEVLLCAPYFDSYKNIVLVNGGVPVVVPCIEDNGFRLTPELLEQHITGNTRWLFLNSPSNPAGAVYSQGDLRALGDVLIRHPDVMVLSDEIYEQIIFDRAVACSFLSVCPELADRILTVNGVSKAHAMTGWRIGYGAGPKPPIAAMVKVQSLSSSGPSTVAQAAAAAALNGSQNHVAGFCEAFERRRNLVMEKIAAVDQLTLYRPGGAFYALIGCARVIGATTPDGTVINDDIAFTQYLLSAGKVACVPGSTYEVSPYFRISTATSDAVLLEALERIVSCVSKLRFT